MWHDESCGNVTGGGSGIGRDAPFYLGQAGPKWRARFNPLLLRRRRCDQEEWGDALGIQMDVSQKSQIYVMVEQVLKVYGTIDILVNIAGIDIKGLVSSFRRRPGTRSSTSI